MLFTVIDRNHSIPAVQELQAFLRIDNWDDWGKFRTQFGLTIAIPGSGDHIVGKVKIGQIGLLPGSEVVGPGVRSPSVPATFPTLGSQFFSLGQSETYYEELNKFEQQIRRDILIGLRDVAFNLDLLDQVSDELVFSESLTRNLSLANVRNRFHRLATGNATLTKFQFNYMFPSSGANPIPPAHLGFVVTPESMPPTNVHVLIGRNGVGKTHCMQNIAKSLLLDEDNRGESGSLVPIGDNKDEWSFAGLISVSFSAFYDFDMPQPPTSGITASSVGLRYTDPITGLGTTKTPLQLAQDFTKSFGASRAGLKAERWRKAVESLSNDPVFADANPMSLLELSDEQWEQQAEEYFHKKLSSGHKIVLLTITRLVELVDERTLVLIDEPEGHLHPPLLSAFIRTLADLLVQRNGVAIIATHSPVVLQEVPSLCVWTLRRDGYKTIPERPTIETFGENVGMLTREVFGLEVTTAGFHDLLRDAVLNKQFNYEQVVAYFGDQLGGEARAIARGLEYNRDKGVTV
jgi:predicted ATPase